MRHLLPAPLLLVLALLLACTSCVFAYNNGVITVYDGPGCTNGTSAEVFSDLNDEGVCSTLITETDDDDLLLSIKMACVDGAVFAEVYSGSSTCNESRAEYTYRVPESGTVRSGECTAFPGGEASVTLTCGRRSSASTVAVSTMLMAALAFVTRVVSL